VVTDLRGDYRRFRSPSVFRFLFRHCKHSVSGPRAYLFIMGQIFRRRHGAGELRHDSL
jgi:hypothetical protein